MSLIDGPTAVEPAEALFPYLERDRVWVKRDDRVSSHYGGNKVRRFEYLFADARARGKTHLLTVGGLASTQVLATIIHGKRAGLEVGAVLFDQPVTAFLRRQLLADVAAGGHLIRGGGYLGTVGATLLQLLRQKDSYFVWPGASTPLANLGYVDAMLELGQQIDQGMMPVPDIIVVPAGSGGTVAGLAVGAALLGYPTQVVGVRITEKIACNGLTIGMLARATQRLLQRREPSLRDFAWPPVRGAVEHRFAGKGYGKATPEAVLAVPWVEKLLSTPGETTYSGKALAALRVLGKEQPKANILFWATLSSAPLSCADEGDLPPEFARYFVGNPLL